MIGHLCKLVWNRKRANGLIVAEIFVSFLILSAVATLGVYTLDTYRQSLGYSYENIWALHISTKNDPQRAATLQQVYTAIRSMEEIEGFAGVSHSAIPYGSSSSRRDIEYQGRSIMVPTTTAADDFAEVADLQLLDGRWFEEGDEVLNWDPVVINQRLSWELFGAENPLGKNIAPSDRTKEMRVVGVISDFRKDGEFAGLGNFLFQRMALNTAPTRPTLLLKVRPGATTLFEERLVSTLQSLAKDWSFKLETLKRTRAASHQQHLALLSGVVVISAFLMLMVGLGLVGVLWQSVVQRTEELGLRRALGATGSGVRRQVVGELLALTSISTVFGLAVALQFPLLGVIGFVSGKVYIYGLALSLLLMYSLVVLCGLYPSWLATRVQPAQALHYE
ncbi:MAG: ABC transporter permease [Candidatus Latescibacteria bacterium]|nr:ABC transporter permease [Candidatus Latescibacterota bacterium]